MVGTTNLQPISTKKSLHPIELLSGNVETSMNTRTCQSNCKAQVVLTLCDEPSLSLTLEGRSKYNILLNDFLVGFK